MKKKRVWIPLVVVGVIILFAIISIFLKGRSNPDDVGGGSIDEPVQVEKVREEILEEAILVSGTIVPEDEQKVFLDAENGEIQEYFVEESAKVKAGDPLFVYSETTIDNEIKSAKRDVQMIVNNVAQEENEIAQMNKQIQQLRNEQGAVATERANQKKEIEKAKAAKATRDKEIAKAVKEAEKAEDPNSVVIPEPYEMPYFDDIPAISNDEIQELEIQRDGLILALENTKSEIETAENVVKELEEAKENLTVKSKISGTVVKVAKNIDPANSGSEPVIHIISDEPFKVVGSMSELDTVKIKTGQDVIITPKVFKDREWKGKVESVSEYPEGSDEESYDMYGEGDGGLTMYPFKVTIDGDTSDLRQGFHVSLEVIAKNDTPSVVVSHGALLDDMMMESDEEDMSDMFFGDFSYEEPSQFVYVLVDGVIERRDVEVGNMSDEYVEITYGVDIGELVIVYPSPDLQEGMEVTDYDEIE